MSLADKISLLKNTKENIRKSIVEQGVDVSYDTPFSEYPSKILSIVGSGKDLKEVIEGSATDVVIPEGTTSIRSYMFYHCSTLKSVEIPEGVESIGEHAFYHCTGLTSVEIPNSVTNMYRNVFDGCYGLTNVAIGNGITSIPNYCFYGCNKLASINIPDSVIEIKDYAFALTALTNITIPSSVTKIYSDAFFRCQKLAKIDFSSHTAIPWLQNSNVFKNVASGCIAVLPDALYDEWIAANVWKDVTTLTYVKKSELGGDVDE